MRGDSRVGVRPKFSGRGPQVSFRCCPGNAFSFCREGSGVGDVAAVAVVAGRFPQNGGETSVTEIAVTPRPSSSSCPPCCCCFCCSYCGSRRGPLSAVMATAPCLVLLLLVPLLLAGWGPWVSLKQPLPSAAPAAAATPSAWGDLGRPAPLLKVSARGARRLDAFAEHPSTFTGRSMGPLDTPFASKELSCATSMSNKIDWPGYGAGWQRGVQ